MTRPRLLSLVLVASVGSIDLFAEASVIWGPNDAK